MSSASTARGVQPWNHSRRRRAAFVASLAGALGLALCAPSAHADTSFRTVLVIDASSSMKRTDPSDLRKVAAELYVDLARRGDRIAVTGFDEKARQSTNGFIAITDTDRRARLKQAIRAIGNDGKWTDFTAGLEEAKRLLAGSAERPGEQSLVVFLTDGRCEPDPKGPLAAEARTSEQRTELCKQKTLDELAGQLGGARVYAIGLSKGAPAAFLEELGRRTGGQGVVTMDPKALPSLFAGVYARLLGSQLREDDIDTRAGFEVYEGARAIDIMIVGKSERTGVLRDPAGSEIAIDNRDPERVYFVAASEYRFYKIQAPRPGTWTVELAQPAKHRLATLQHFDLELSLVSPPGALELGQSVTLRGRLASADASGEAGAGTLPPMDFLDRHEMSAVIGEPGGVVKLAMTRADDGTFTVAYQPKQLGKLPIGLALEPKSGGVLSRALPIAATLEVIPPVHLRAQPVRTEPVKQRASATATLELAGSEAGVPLVLSLALGTPEGAPASAQRALSHITLSPAEVSLPETGEQTSFTLEVAVADRAPGGEHALALTLTPTSPAGFADRAVTVPFVVTVVPLGFWERYGTWVMRGAAGLALLLLVLGFIVPARFKKRAIVYYADIRDPDMIRRSSYPLGSKQKRGFYRAARIALGPSGPVKKGGSVLLCARSGGGIDALPGSKGAAVYRVDLDTDSDDPDRALVSDLDPDERPRVTLTKDGRFRMSANVGYEIAGSGFVFWYK